MAWYCNIKFPFGKILFLSCTVQFKFLHPHSIFTYLIKSLQRYCSICKLNSQNFEKIKKETLSPVFLSNIVLSKRVQFTFYIIDIYPIILLLMQILGLANYWKLWKMFYSANITRLHFWYFKKGDILHGLGTRKGMGLTWGYDEMQMMTQYTQRKRPKSGL